MRTDTSLYLRTLEHAGWLHPLTPAESDPILFAGGLPAHALRPVPPGHVVVVARAEESARPSRTRAAARKAF